MKKSMTRRSFLGVAATAGMAAAALSGCTSGASSSAASASASAASASASAAASSASAASASASAAAAGTALRFVSGGEAGTYYALATLIAQHANKNAGLNITAVSSNGSKANVNELEDGTAQIAFCQSDVEAYAYEGKSLFDGAPVGIFSTVANLYEEQIQIVTCNPDIKTVADLKGKSVSIGAGGSGVYFNALDVLGAYDIAESDIKAQYLNFADSTDQLKDGKIDAAFVVAGAPTASIVDLSTTKQAYLVEVDAEHAAKLIADSPYYNQATIAGGTYKGIDNDVATLSVGAVLIAADSVSEDDIYALTKDIFENLEELAGQHDKFKEFSVEKGASVTAVPYHKGAAKYFKEKNIEVATK